MYPTGRQQIASYVAQTRQAQRTQRTQRTQQTVLTEFQWQGKPARYKGKKAVVIDILVDPETGEDVDSLLGHEVCVWSRKGVPSMERIDKILGVDTKKAVTYVQTGVLDWRTAKGTGRH